MASGAPQGYGLGFKTFDHFFRLKAGQVLVIAGRPAMGKTSFALQIAHNLCRQMTPGTKDRVIFYSAEMSGTQLFQKLASNLSGVNLQAGYAGRWSAADAAEYHRVLNGLSRMPMLVSDLNIVRTDNIRNNLDDMVASGIQPSAVFLDYIELAADEDNGRQEHTRIAGIMQKLKQIAMHYKIPVVALSQVNRQTESESSKIPYLANLAGSDTVARMADKVLTLMRPGYYIKNGQQAACELASDAANTCYVSIQKDRFGRAGQTFRLHVDESTYRFGDFEPPRDPERIVMNLKARKPSELGDLK
jgi:replicative DNA helicase